MSRLHQPGLFSDNMSTMDGSLDLDDIKAKIAELGSQMGVGSDFAAISMTLESVTSTKSALNASQAAHTYGKSSTPLFPLPPISPGTDGVKRAPRRKEATVLADAVEGMLQTAFTERQKLQAEIDLKQHRLEMEMRSVTDMTEMALQQQNEELIDEVESLQEECEMLRQALKQKGESGEQAMKTLSDTLSLVQVDNKKKDLKVTLLNEQMAQLVQTLKHVEADVKIKTAEVARCEKALSDKQDEAKLWTHKYQQLDKKWEAKYLTDEKKWEEKYLADWKVWSGKLMEEEKRRAMDRQRVDRLEEEKARCERLRLDADDRASVLQRKLADSTKDLNDLKKDASSLEIEVTRLKGVVVLKDEVIKQAERTQDTLNEIITRQEEKAKEFWAQKDSQYQQKDKQIQQLSDEVQEARREVQKVKHQIEMCEMKLAEGLERESVLERRLIDADDMFQERELEIEGQFQALHEKQRKLRELQETIEKDKRKVKGVIEMATQIEADKSNAERLMYEAEANIKAIQDEADEAVAMAKVEAEERCANAEARAATAEAMVEELRQRVSAETSQQWSRVVYQKDMQIKTMSEQIDNMRTKIQNLERRGSNIRKSSVVSFLEDSMLSKDPDVAELQKAVQVLSAQNEKLTSERRARDEKWAAAINFKDSQIEEMVQKISLQESMLEDSLASSKKMEAALSASMKEAQWKASAHQRGGSTDDEVMLGDSETMTHSLSTKPANGNSASMNEAGAVHWRAQYEQLENTIVSTFQFHGTDGEARLRADTGNMLSSHVDNQLLVDWMNCVALRGSTASVSLALYDFSRAEPWLQSMLCALPHLAPGLIRQQASNAALDSPLAKKAELVRQFLQELEMDMQMTADQFASDSCELQRVTITATLLEAFCSTILSKFGNGGEGTPSPTLEAPRHTPQEWKEVLTAWIDEQRNWIGLGYRVRAYSNSLWAAVDWKGKRREGSEGMTPDTLETAARATQQGDHDKAWGLYTELIEKGDAQAEVYVSRASVAIALKKFDAARADLDQAAEQGAQSTWVQKVRGDVELAERPAFPKAALECYDRSLELGNTRDPSLWFNRGTCLARLGDAEGAFRSFGTCLELSPEYPARQAYDQALADLKSAHCKAAGDEIDAVLAENPPVQLEGDPPLKVDADSEDTLTAIAAILKTFHWARLCVAEAQEAFSLASVANTGRGAECIIGLLVGKGVDTSRLETSVAHGEGPQIRFLVTP
uniref:Uncharacterized protein n=1 Tax=Eutreptiella gymnastica TaxID=73025 RepID=A0A7S1IS66_9EUGL|mmetsp:Transcript_39051/g.69970  ORF Transcript_39051/g.69970 Transcript_39051/m.69970 type:complete len:1226 (+) Transcript_39051:89-3766(+)